MDKIYEDYMEQNNDTAPTSVQEAYKAVHKVLDECIDIISEYKFNCGYNWAKSEMTDNRWIPVSERLPETEDGYDYVLVSMDDEFIATTAYTDDGGFDLWYDSGDVVAWMPLPEPYKPEVDTDA